MGYTCDDDDFTETFSPLASLTLVGEEGAIRHLLARDGTLNFTPASLVIFLLVYFTGEGLAMLLLFLILFITFEAVLIKKRDPEPWRHVFSIIYYGFGDANRYAYYSKVEKIRQVFLSKVRNQNGLNREEFQAMQANELVSMINDPVLAKFAVESSNKYTLEQTVALVKRIKAWGRQ